MLSQLRMIWKRTRTWCDTSTASVNLYMSVGLAQWKKHPHRHRCCLMIAVGEAVEGYRLHDIGGVYWITCRHWRFMQCALKWLYTIDPARATAHVRCAAVLNVLDAVMLCYDVLTLCSLRRWKNSDKASSKHLLTVQNLVQALAPRQKRVGSLAPHACDCCSRSVLGVQVSTAKQCE